MGAMGACARWTASFAVVCALLLARDVPLGLRVGFLFEHIPVRVEIVRFCQ